MSAVLLPTLRPMRAGDIGAVAAIEAGAYAFPWSRGNFVDSLAAGYGAQVAVDGGGRVVGYSVAMAGVDEMHLLNITVAPAWRGRGLASYLLDALDDRCRVLALPVIWLEVRAGNEHARAVYARRGYAEVGLRRDYYPAPHGQREDAVVMSVRVPAR